MVKRISTFCALAVAAFCFAGTAVAADNSGQNKSQQLISSYQQDAKKLKQIHDKAVQKNPELAKEQKQFQDKVRDEIKNQGYDLDSGQERMQSIAKKLQSKDLNDKQRKQAMQKFQKERGQMMKARSAALSQPEVKKSGEQLQDDTISAMKKQNPKTKELIAEMKNLRKQMQQSSGAQQPGSNNQ